MGQGQRPHPLDRAEDPRAAGGRVVPEPRVRGLRPFEQGVVQRTAAPNRAHPQQRLHLPVARRSRVVRNQGTKGVGQLTGAAVGAQPPVYPVGGTLSGMRGKHLAQAARES